MNSVMRQGLHNWIVEFYQKPPNYVWHITDQERPFLREVLALADEALKARENSVQPETKAPHE